MKNVTIPDPQLMKKHGITQEEFTMFFETDAIQYGINSNASQFYGASIAERNSLARKHNNSPAEQFEAKYKKTWQQARAELLDKFNDYALEYYNFRKSLGSPNGKEFW